jgi:hypothetical protein
MIGLSCSYILSSGVVKDAGRELLRAGVSEWWMPALAGLLFLPTFLLAVALLHRLPPPDAADVAARCARPPMGRGRRLEFLRFCGAGLGLVLVSYFFLTAYRDFRDHYGREVFRALGYDGTPAVFSRSELGAAFGVMAALAGLNLVRGHRRALLALFGLMAGGYALVGGATLLFQAGHLSGLAWMSAIGLGLYVAYVPFGSLLFGAALPRPGLRRVGPPGLPARVLVLRLGLGRGPDRRQRGPATAPDRKSEVRSQGSEVRKSALLTSVF